MTDNKQYPPLPDFEEVAQHVYWVSRGYIPRGMLEPIHELMRAYVDADRAMRAAQAAPAYVNRTPELNVGELGRWPTERPMNMRAQQFLLELAELIERHGGAYFYYTNGDDGVHIKMDGDRDDCFVGFGLDPKELRAAAATGG